MDKPHFSATSDNQRTRLVALLACIMLGGLLLAGVYLSLVAERIAAQQTQQQGELLGQQTVTLIKPALLAADPVSLNFILNQLVRQPHIDAIRLTDTKERVLGRAGESSESNDLHLNITIQQQKQTLAFLELQLNSAPYLQQLNNLLIQASILAFIVIILALIGCWFLINQTKAPSRKPDDKQDLKPVSAGANNEPETEAIISKPTLTSNAYDPEADSDLKQAPALATSELSEPLTLTIPRPNSSSEQDDEQLVDLLRPSDDAPQMPGFAPFTEHKQNDKAELQTSPQQHPIVEEIDIAPQPRPKTKNPLFENAKHEVQLDLYAFEQELELIVAAENAGYLLYLDLATGHSDNIQSDELHELQEYYYRMLDMVIAIYQGEAARISNGDLQLAFLKPHKDDSHGINAICASQLFNRLYKLFNQQRIRQLKPVLNLHMALVRGHHKKLPRLQEEARYLTRSTDSNELITHTALSEAPDLKVSLLAGAGIQRAEEDKVLIVTVNENYQKLLDKQAQHLLNKLFP